MKEKRDIKKLLIVVDMVKGFITEGNMADPGIAHIVPRLLDAIEEYKDEGLIFIKDTHPEGAAEFRKFPVHCIENTSESELIEEFKPYEKDALVYEKNSTSAMFAPGFLEDLSEMTSLEEVVVTGCCTDICVINLAIPLTNWFDQQNRTVQIRCPKNLMETYDAPVHKRDEYNAMTVTLMEQVGVTTEEY